MQEEYNQREIQNKKEFKVPNNNNNIDNKKNLIYLFIATFFIAIIFVSIILRGLTPNMDLDIGENPVASMNQRGDEDVNIRAQIDQRLKMIQNDDDMPGVSAGYETPEEIVNRLRSTNEDTQKIEDSKNAKKEDEKNTFTMEPVRVNPQDVNKNTSTTITKIYIGQFSDMNKAVEMQANIMNAGMNINPIIKEVNGYYTIQVGAYSNHETAKAIAAELNNAGFSAKIVREIR